MTTGLSSPADLVSRAQSGDPAARDQLMREMMPFIRYIAKRRMGCKPTEDMIQDGVVGLLEALQRYNPSEYAASFKTFAFYRINGSIKDGLAAESEFRSRWETNELDAISSPDKSSYAVVNLSCLSEQQRMIVERHFGLNGSPTETFKEIGDSIGLTSARVRQILRATLAKLAILLSAD